MCLPFGADNDEPNGVQTLNWCCGTTSVHAGLAKGSVVHFWAAAESGPRVALTNPHRQLQAKLLVCCVCRLRSCRLPLLHLQLCRAQWPPSRLPLPPPPPLASPVPPSPLPPLAPPLPLVTTAATRLRLEEEGVGGTVCHLTAMTVDSEYGNVCPTPKFPN